MTNILDLYQISLRFGGLSALSSVDLSVPENSIVSVIGPNGAGKTSLFNVITGVYEPTEGTVCILGKKAERPFRMLVAFTLFSGALACGVLFHLAVNISGWWEAAILSKFIYQQPFAWMEGIRSGIAFLLSASPWPFIFGFLLSICGGYVLWDRSRRVPEYKACLGLARTFQNIRLFHKMTALDNVLVGMDLRYRSGIFATILRFPKAVREERRFREEALEFLRLVEIEGYADQYAVNLSYGHQRRLEIARALALQPKILLLDEPAAGANPTEAQSLMNLIQRISERGIAILLIEHHMKVVMGISHHIVVLDYGEKIAEGNPAEIQSNPRVIEAYLGKSEE